MQSLVVIEAPGKIPVFERMLRTLGYGWRVVATSGHLCRHGESLWPLGITQRYEEPGRSPNTARSREIVKAARERVVFLATDDDAEGDVIARDVDALVRPVAKAVCRLRVPAMTPAALRQALANPEAPQPSAARQGDARRILDRLIGHTWSRRGAPVGRVLTPLLAAMQRKPPIVGAVRLVVPCPDGGPPWRVDVAYTAAEREMWRERLKALESHPGVKRALRRTAPPQQAWGYTELVRAAAGRANPLEMGEGSCA